MLPFLVSMLVQTTHAVPLQMTHQGRLVDNSGAAVTGVHVLTFSIYDSETGGTLQWSEPLAVQFNNGYYATILGSDTQTNALDSSILEFYPLYLEISVDQGTPLSPRRALNAVPYSQISGLSEVARSLEDGPVNATNISIDGQPVIDSNGNWVGPNVSIDWSDINSATIPSGLSDGDNDTLGGLNCSNGEIITWAGTGWVCTSDSRLSLGDVSTYLSNTAINLQASTTIGGQPILTLADDSDTLLSLNCADSEVAKYDLALDEWYCSGGSSLTEADVELYIENGPIDLAANSTMNGRILVAAPPSCTHGQILSFDANNSNWTCVDFASVLDADGDGVLAWQDCNDNDANFLAIANDTDCDGFDSSVDCDDNNESVTNFGTGASATCPATSCLSILNDGYSNGSQLYFLDINSTSKSVYCDMVTDGGGWTILYSATGANGEGILTGDSTAGGNPLTFQHHNRTRADKVALSALSSETLYYRNNGVWIKSNQPPFTSALLNSNQHFHTAVTLTASNGASASGFQGWANYNNSGGGDFNLSQSDGSTCSGTTSNGVDHHSGNYYHLNCGCQRHYLYSYSQTTQDGDAGYDVSSGLGTWNVTAACDSAEGGSLSFYVAVR